MAVHSTFFSALCASLIFSSTSSAYVIDVTDQYQPRHLITEECQATKTVTELYTVTNPENDLCTASVSDSNLESNLPLLIKI